MPGNVTLAERLLPTATCADTPSSAAAAVDERLAPSSETRTSRVLNPYIPRRASTYGSVRSRIFTSLHSDQPATYR